MENGFNALIVGNNTRHALIFKEFCDNVYILVNEKRTVSNRLNSDLDKLNVIYERKFNSLTKPFKRISELRAIAKKHKINVVFTNRKDDLFYARMAFLLKRNRPIILCTFHNSLAWGDKAKTKILSLLIKRWCDGCVCLAKGMYNILEKNIGSSKLIYLPNTIYADAVAQKPNYELVHAPQISIVYISTIYPNKNQLFAIRAIKELSKSFDAKMDFIGEISDENYFAALKEEIERLGLQTNIKFVGSVDNDALKSKVLNTYDIYFSPSLKEMSPLNILEAKACGLPVVASHAFGQQDLIKDGVDGYLYEDGDVQSAVAKLTALIRDIELRKKIGEGAKRYSETINTPQNASLKLEEYIKHHVQKNRHH